MKRLAISIGLVLLSATPALADDPAPIPRDRLLEDARLLAQTIENVHPDPYLRGGGKIAFHRRLQDVLGAIPAGGLSAHEFGRLVEPFVAAVGDGHTAIDVPRSSDPHAPGGIPLYFDAIDGGLYVALALAEEHRGLIGARLLSVEGVPLAELVDRYRLRRGADNGYLLLRNLGTQGVLWNGRALRELVPEWTRTDAVRITLRMPGGDARALDLAIPARIDYGAIVYPPMSDPALVQDLMTTLQRTDLFYRFLDPERRTCLLVIRSLMTYREAFEAWRSLGIAAREPAARALYQRGNGAAAPADYDSVLAGLPSATEIFREMVGEMKEAGTQALLVDLSQDDGGSSLLGTVLLYFLYGREELLDQLGRTVEIVKYSPEYFEVFPTPPLAGINRGRSVPLTETDYDFDGDHARGGPAGREAVRRELEDVIAWMPTFRAEYESGAHEAFYRPPRVLALCDAGTFSAAFTVLCRLWRAGAETVGIPSAQAGNCFGDIVDFELPNSGLGYHVSRKYFELFPDDPERGRLLVPDHHLTYERLASYGFDAAALILFALDVAEVR